jgi:hypothetical protein
MSQEDGKLCRVKVELKKMVQLLEEEEAKKVPDKSLKGEVEHVDTLDTGRGKRPIQPREELR